VSNLAWEAADVGGKGHGPGGAEGNGGGSDRWRPRTVARVRGTAYPPLRNAAAEGGCARRAASYGWFGKKRKKKREQSHAVLRVKMEEGVKMTDHQPVRLAGG
jgi:hypothetical protein